MTNQPSASPSQPPAQSPAPQATETLFYMDNDVVLLGQSPDGGDAEAGKSRRVNLQAKQ